ncbi:hypothetical protein GCM10007940_03990 [Portibacter lacus]|uniref:TonB C-terminal domain-containing protein n=1 Tax=Portibacter lacus TaxID=1099794 RepID=A0AA37SLB9_9BACT|nr:hypothetical protein GCM10007940_03990 [Portibacter lacus]
MEFVPWKNESNVAHVIYPMLMEIDDLQAVVARKEVDTFNWMNILYFIYAVGFIVSFVRFSMGIKRVLELFWASEKTVKNGYTLVMTEEKHLPFSFFNWVFFSKKMSMGNEIDGILHHEIEHIKGRHSIDVLVTELLKVIFWCSPMIYLYKNALKEIHEYLADQVVIKNTDKKTYKQLLLTQTNNSLQMALTHQFFNSHLKNRLKMINQKRSGRPTLVMYALGIPVLLLLLFAFTFAIQGPNATNENVPELIQNIGKYYMEEDPQKAPYFQIDGKDIELPLFNHISLYGNIGNAVVLLPEDAIRKFGERAKLGYINFERPILKQKELLVDGYNPRKYRYDAELIVSGMEVRKKYFPNNAVKLEKTIPSAGKKMMTILMAGISTDVTEKNIGPRTFNEELETDYESIARFPACEDKGMKDRDLLRCSYKEMLDYVYSNLEYPEKARKNGVHGSASIDFVVTSKGELEDFNIYRNLGGGCAYAALDAVKKLKDLDQKWIPAMKDGKAVNMRYVLPIRFELDEEGRDAYESLELKVDTIPAQSTRNIETTNEIFKVVEQMPRFPGCESISGTNAEKEDCAKQKMLEYIYTNLKYPKVARDAGIEGMAVVQFVITSEGRIKDAKVVRSLSPETDEETLKVVESMDFMDSNWTPGYQRGNAVNVQYTLPIRFKLEGDKAKEGVLPLQEVEIKKNISADNASKPSPLIYVDGALYEGEVNDIDKEKIASVNVIKGEPAIAQYGEQAKDGVINITTKESVVKPTTKNIVGKAKPIIYVDGALYEEEVDDIDNEEIATINIYKGESAIVKYGEQAKDGVINITTKAGQDKGEVDSENDANFKIYENRLASTKFGNERKIYAFGKVIKNGPVSFMKPSLNLSDYRKERMTEIRAIGTIEGADSENVEEPFIVVDGEEKDNSEFSMDEIKPDDIASINVLKGETAIEKYGYKGVNGVIEITTKNAQGKVENYKPGPNNTPAYFPGCDDETDAAAKDKCSKTNLINYLYKNIKYPAEARKQGVEGMVVTSFVIDQNGKMKNFNLKRKVAGLDDSALAIIDKMAKEIVWTPAMKDGKAVAMEFNLPISYKLPAEKQADKEILEIREGGELSLQQVAIFPNPAKEMVNIKFEAEAKPVILDLFNIEGKQLYQKVYSDFNGSFDQSINLTQFSEKVILIRVSQEGKTFTRKLVVE